MVMHPLQPRRRSLLRLRGFDYAQPGAYFVTVCKHRKLSLFGDVVEGELSLTPFGEIVAVCWRAIPSHFPRVRLDLCVTMPNHVHGILRISSILSDTSATDAVGATHASPLRCTERRPGLPDTSLGAIVGSFKAAATRRINVLRRRRGAPVWQRGFYEHVIRDEEDLDRVRRYIDANPQRWSEDEERSEHRVP